MSGLMHKVKDVIHGGHKDENAKLEHDALHGEHGSQSGVHDTPISGSVAHGDSTSATNPGVLDSTERGIHGDRDTGTSGTGLSNKEFTGQTATEGSGFGSGMGSGYDSTTRDTGLGSGANAGPQYTGTSERDTGLIGSGIDTTGRGTTMDESSMNAGSGSSYNPNDRSGGQDVLTGSGSHTRDTGIVGSTGSGYDSSSRMDRDNTTTGSGLGSDEGMIAGGSIPQTGSGYDANTRGADMTSGGTGSGLTGNDSGMGSGYDSNTRDTGLTGGGSGLGSGYDSNTRDTGLTGGESGLGSGYDSNTRDSGLTGGGMSGTGSGLTGGDSGFGSGTGSSGTTGLVGEGDRYVEGSEMHHRGDGHPEDIVHPGPHYTGTAKALDPHLN